MPQIRLHANIKPLARVLNSKVAAGTAKNLRTILPEIADFFIRRVRAGPWFTHETGALKKGLYRSAPRLRQSGGEIDVGWSGPASIYGPVLEFGPNKKSWRVEPKGKKADGTPVKALRWVANGKVFYSKGYTRTWKTSSLRPHMMPTAKRLRPFIQRKIGQAVDDAWKGSGL